MSAEYPAGIKGRSENHVEVFLYLPRNLDDIRKLDDCEDEPYFRDTAEVIVSDGQVFQAYLYVWCNESEELSDRDWDFEELESKWVKKTPG